MKLASVLLAAAALLAGCRHAMPILDKRGQPVAKSDAPWRNERMAAGVAFGNSDPVPGDAIEEMDGSRFRTAQVMGARMCYFFSTYKYGPKHLFATRYGIELQIDDQAFALEREGFKYGRLRLNSGVLAFRFLLMPEERKVIGFHAEFGLGQTLASFSRDYMLRSSDSLAGTLTEIVPESAATAVGGAGVDFYFPPGFAVSLGYRYLYAPVPVKWTVDGVEVPGRDTFDASCQQLVLTLRYHF